MHLISFNLFLYNFIQGCSDTAEEKDSECVDFPDAIDIENCSEEWREQNEELQEGNAPATTGTEANEIKRTTEGNKKQGTTVQRRFLHQRKLLQRKA